MTISNGLDGQALQRIVLIYFPDPRRSTVLHYGKHSDLIKYLALFEPLTHSPNFEVETSRLLILNS